PCKFSNALALLLLPGISRRTREIHPLTLEARRAIYEADRPLLRLAIESRLASLDPVESAYDLLQRARRRGRRRVRPGPESAAVSFAALSPGAVARDRSRCPALALPSSRVAQLSRCPALALPSSLDRSFN